MSASPKSPKSKKFFHLRQLQLAPHYIYLVDQPDFSSEIQYSLEMWKDNSKIGFTDDITKIVPNDFQKFATLQFQKVRFAFDVEALFQDEAQTKIKLKLTQSRQGQSYELEQFTIHILYYTYQFSKDRFVKHKQNSIGQKRNYILNYSFSAIYGQPSSSLLFRKYQHDETDPLLRDLGLIKKESNNSKYGLLIKETVRKNPLDTFMLIEAVTGANVPEFKQSGNVEEEDDFDQQDWMGSVEGVESSARHAARSILLIDRTAVKEDDSQLSVIDVDFQEVKTKWVNLGQWILIIVGGILIFLLMHPNIRA